MRPVIHPQCAVQSASLTLSLHPQEGLLLLSFPAIQHFSKSLLNDKCILKTEVPLLCHNAKGNRNFPRASCKYTQSEEQF